ncbi:TPA: TcdA/TcdB catalytic glycosyltransferase domain-containing protein [Serratia odorifera]
MTHKVLDIDLSKVEKILAPNILHFVWVGDLNKVNTHYIEIWRRTNKDKALFFWHDRNASLCNFLNSSIRDFINIKKIKYKEMSVFVRSICSPSVNGKSWCASGRKCASAALHADWPSA